MPHIATDLWQDSHLSAGALGVTVWEGPESRFSSLSCSLHRREEAVQRGGPSGAIQSLRPLCLFPCTPPQSIPAFEQGRERGFRG